MVTTGPPRTTQLPTAQGINISAPCGKHTWPVGPAVTTVCPHCALHSRGRRHAWNSTQQPLQLLPCEAGLALSTSVTCCSTLYLCDILITCSEQRHPVLGWGWTVTGQLKTLWRQIVSIEVEVGPSLWSENIHWVTSISLKRSFCSPTRFTAIKVSLKNVRRTCVFASF